MTKITKLYLHGFKSFAKKTEIEFGDQFNCMYPLIEEKFNIMQDVYVKKTPVNQCGTNIKSEIFSLRIENIQDKFESIQDKNEKMIGKGCGAVF